MNNDPWKDLTPPCAGDTISAQRVDANIPWGFFWARDVDRKCLLVLRHGVDAAPGGHLPRLKDIDITLSNSADASERVLVFRLQDSAQRDIFHRLCKDVVSSASATSTEKEAVETALRRTWRWHHLLRGGGGEQLSAEEQKGLIGELLVLERHLLPQLSPLDAVTSWGGPLGAPKDFEIGRICIEAKARRGAAAPYVAISSEHQLDASGIDELFLYVVELDQAPSDADKSFILTSVCTRIRERISAVDNVALDIFETLLAASGFRWTDDYEGSRWLEGASRFFRICDDFPCIRAGDVAPGVSAVRYSLSLPSCKTFAVTDTAVASAIRRLS